MNNYMPTKWTPQKKWANSQKETTFKTEEEKRMENMNRPITSTEIESDLNLLTSKSPSPDVFIGEF